MKRLGSLFLDDFVKEDKPVFFHFTKRGVLLVVGTVTTLSVSTLLFFLGYPDLLVVLVTILLFAPTIVVGLGVDKKLSFVERFYFFLLIKRRLYQMEDHTRKEYHARDFIQAKTVRETDPA